MFVFSKLSGYCLTNCFICWKWLLCYIDTIILVENFNRHLSVNKLNYFCIYDIYPCMKGIERKKKVLSHFVNWLYVNTRPHTNTLSPPTHTHKHTHHHVNTQTHIQSARSWIHEKHLQITQSGTLIFIFSNVFPLYLCCSLLLK